MKLRDLSDVKVEVMTSGQFETPWCHDGDRAIVLANPLSGQLEAALLPSGLLRVFPGYMCDGPSGPTFDDATNRIPAVIHDVAYQLLRSDLAPPSLTRKSADLHMYHMLVQYGMPRWRAWLWYHGLRIGGAGAAKPRKIEKKYTLLAS